MITRGVFILICFILSSSSYAWNATGHQLIARLALAQLTSQETTKLQAYNEAYQFGYHPKTLPQAAVWLDWIRCSQPLCQTLSKYHYIDLPYSNEGMRGLPPQPENGVFAIRQAMRILNQPVTDAEKGLQLRILLHVVGDLHQPLHTISLYNAHFPEGDKGGNLYILGKNHLSKNLHAYWDRGGGYLTYKPKSLPIKIARLQKKYPCKLNQMNLNPTDWATESFTLAKTVAYSVKEGEKPGHSYQRRVKEITEQRISLAACRLAALLKEIPNESFQIK